MRPADGTPRFTRTPHLVALVAETERLAASIDAADPDDPTRWRQELLQDATVATLQLDGSPIAAPRDQRGTWIDAIKLSSDPDEVPDEAIVAREFANTLGALAADDLAEALVDAPTDTLAELHRRLTTGLLDDEHAGALRRTEQTVQDSSVGRIIYFCAPPAEIAGRLHVLAGWLATAAAREHGLVVSGVVHHELLHIHPFEAANGRLARAAARFLLRTRGLDPLGGAAAERWLLGDSLGYQEEVARTARRRDLTIWLERWGEAVTGGLRATADRLGVLDVQVPGRAAGFVAARGAGPFTIADYRAEAAAGPEDARADLAALLDAGAVARVPGSRGLRFTVLPR